MYLPKSLEETRIDVLHDLIRQHPLGTWVMAGDDELNVNHIPFFLAATQGEFGTLIGHVARANSIWKTRASIIPSTIVFRGPQTYITPSWYPSKRQHGKTVPTWNYAVVAAHGIPEFIEDQDWLHRHLTDLTDVHEASQALPWKIDDAPPEFTKMMMAAIVGVQIPIKRIEGKWKVNQNRPELDRKGVIAGLLGKGDDNSLAMASLVRKSVEG